MPDPQPVRTTPVGEFIRDRSGMRVGTDALELMVAKLTEATAQLTDLAKEAALEDNRSTIMERDVEAAFDLWLDAQARTLLSPAIMHQTIETISNDGLVELTRLLKGSLERS